MSRLATEHLCESQTPPLFIRKTYHLPISDQACYMAEVHDMAEIEEDPEAQEVLDLLLLVVVVVSA